VAVVTDVDAVIEHHARWTVERHTLDDEIDGIAIKLDDLKDRERLGAIAHHSRWAMAYNFEPRREVTEKGGHSDGERRDRPRTQGIRRSS
jgi:DNA ligase (NAD+)